MLKGLFISMRPWQWYKNTLLFVALIFSRNLFNLELFKATALGFAAFCLASGSQYIFNDILDRERDRMHPKKCRRPIASGMVSIYAAAVFATSILTLSFIISLQLSLTFFVTVLGYFLLSSLYSVLLKNLVLLDVLIVSIGFVIRAIAGCFAINVAISPWLILCTFSLATFLALGKRRHELVLLKVNAKGHRETLGLYSREAIDHLLTAATSITVVSYSLYTFTESLKMMVTIPIAVYGLFRYLLLIHTKGVGDEPAIAFKDKGLLLSVVLWTMLIIVALYW